MAGQSAAAHYRVVRASARRRRVATVVLVVVAAGTLAPLLVGAGAPWLVAVSVAAALAAWRWRPEADPERWLRGASGELATAQLLERLPRRRWVVVHDRSLPGSRANVDHLAIGPSGVWVIDTKAYRAPLRVRRGQVWAGDHAIPVEPVRWEGQRVAERLGVEVIPIVAVHGQGLRRRGKRCGDVWVIPATRLVRRLRRGRRVLDRPAVAALGARVDDVLPER